MEEIIEMMKEDFKNIKSKGLIIKLLMHVDI